MALISREKKQKLWHTIDKAETLAYYTYLRQDYICGFLGKSTDAKSVPVSQAEAIRVPYIDSDLRLT